MQIKILLFVFYVFSLVGMEESESFESDSLLQRACVICTKKNLLGTIPFVQLSCGHFAHVVCFNKMKGTRCPLCKVRVFENRTYGYDEGVINCVRILKGESKKKIKKKGCCFRRKK